MRIRLDRAYTAEEIAARTGGRTAACGVTVRHLTTDSREVEAGDLFVALCGKNYDGERFLFEAEARGAALLLCVGEGGSKRICVSDTRQALAHFAHTVRTEIAPTVIAITGSVGKTTTKNMTAAILEKHFRTHKTQGNLNNLLGASLTLLSMPHDTDVLVVELGMNHAGELAELSSLVRPDIAIITNVGRAHIENFGSREAIARAKQEILFDCAPDAPYLYPADDPLLRPPCRALLTPMTVAAEEGGDCRYEDLRCDGERATVDIVIGKRRYAALPLPSIGAHIANCATYAVAVATLLGLSASEIRRGLADCPQDDLRQHIVERGGVRMIIDCYNASPESMRAACAVLMQSPGARRIALLGDMLELGADTRALHEEVGELFARAGLDMLLTFGAEADSIAIGAMRAGMPPEAIYRNSDPEAHAASASLLASLLHPGDVLLIKASRARRAEQILSLLPQEYKI